MLDRSKWRFFHREAGGIVGQQAVNAAALARAEAWREDEEDAGRLRVVWDWDGCADWSEYPDAGGFTPTEILACRIETRADEDAPWECGACLCGIGDPDRAYARVVEAELTLEVMTSSAPAQGGKILT